jgi:hypothetical protein
MRILLLRPESDDPSAIDQALGVRLSAQARSIDVTEEVFQRDDDTDLKNKVVRWQGKVSAVIGATNVPESTRLGEVAAEMNLLCFVANNNPLVWQGRRVVFHIGLPTNQTTAAVAALIKKTNRRRLLLLHDETEFQSRVASTMEGASGGCCFSRDNHNGRFEPGPHTITRWRNHQLEDLRSP